MFNITSQVDKATPIVKRYLDDNVKDLELLADNQSSIDTTTREKIKMQLNELSIGLHK
jgi:hypothetical protein